VKRDKADAISIGRLPAIFDEDEDTPTVTPAEGADANTKACGTVPSFRGQRTRRVGELCDMLAKATGRDRREFLEQFIQDWFGGRLEAFAEAANERVASQSLRRVSADDLLLQMKGAFKRQDLTQEAASLLSIKDWEYMGDDGRLVLRLIEGLRLTSPAFHSWYQTAHLREHPDIWPNEGTEDVTSASGSTKAPEHPAAEAGANTVGTVASASSQPPPVEKSSDASHAAPKRSWVEFMKEHGVGRTHAERLNAALLAWARAQWSDPSTLPNRDGLLSAFRDEFGDIDGINDKTIRVIRSKCATDAAKKGGAPAQKRWRR
jgi:hypothetical protein